MFIWVVSDTLQFLKLFNFVDLCLIIIYILGGARGVMVIVIGYGHDDTSSIPGQDWLHFT